MRKIKNFVLGGLQQKIFNLVVISIILIEIAFMLVVSYQQGKLTGLIHDTNERQKSAIEETTDGIMEQVIDSTMMRSIELEGYIADNLFSEVENSVNTFGGHVQSVLENPDDYKPRRVVNPLFKMDDSLRTGDEIEVLGNAFEEISLRPQDYIANIREITAEKERIGTELELATRIQADMLPNIFPPFPKRKDIDIYASMEPVKEVGGDFYDFFLMDDDHLGMVMADVSGKGVPAALFMMMTKILVNSITEMGDSPKETLERVNTLICQNNDEGMFVTVWLGILTISTGKIVAANAGHEYPIIRKANGQFEVYKDRHGFVIGGMENVKYREYEMTLEKGGTLFLYTDGVPEAMNTSKEMFGLDRMLEVLNRDPDADSQTLLTRMTEAVNEFAGEEPQFDDLTMLAVRI